MSCTFIFYFSFTVFTSKPNACQGKDWPGSNVLKIHLTRKSISWLDITNDILGRLTAGQKYSALQVRKVRFLTDYLASRNYKQALRKSTYWHSNVFRSLQMQCHVFCACTKIFLASKQVRKSWYSRTKKNYINFVHTCSYSGPSILEKTKETKAI